MMSLARDPKERVDYPSVVSRVIFGIGVIWDQAAYESTVIPAKLVLAKAGSGNPILGVAFSEAWKLDSRLRGNDGMRGARNWQMTPLPRNPIML